MSEQKEFWGMWEELEELKYTLALSATPAQRLAWLEEMIELAYRSGALPRRDPVD